MSAQSLLDQLLKTGLAAFNDARGSLQGLADRSELGKYASGAAAGGMLALQLGTRSGRRIGGVCDQARQPGGAGHAGLQDLQRLVFASTAHSRVLLKALIAAAMCDGHRDDREGTGVP